MCVVFVPRPSFLVELHIPWRRPKTPKREKEGKSLLWQEEKKREKSFFCTQICRSSSHFSGFVFHSLHNTTSCKQPPAEQLDSSFGLRPHTHRHNLSYSSCRVKARTEKNYAQLPFHLSQAITTAKRTFICACINIFTGRSIQASNFLEDPEHPVKI